MKVLKFIKLDPVFGFKQNEILFYLKGSFGGVIDLYDAALHLGPVQRSLGLVCVLGVVEGHEAKPL